MTNHAVTCNASQKTPVDWAIGIKGNTQANGAKEYGSLTQNHHPDGFFYFYRYQESASGDSSSHPLGWPLRIYRRFLSERHKLTIKVVNPG